MKLRCPASALVLLPAAWFAGCATPGATTSAPPPAHTSSSNAASAAAAAAQYPFAALRRGMPPEAVTALLGPPRTIQPARNSDVSNVVWTYQRVVSTTTTTEATRTRQVPYFDPFTQMIRMIDEPDFQPLVVSVVETVTLLFVDGKLEQWGLNHETKREYN